MSLNTRYVGTSDDSHACRHVLDVHRQAGMQRAGDDEEALQDEQFLRRYIEYCRARVSPRLSETAASTLASEYVELREEVRRPCPSHRKMWCCVFPCDVAGYEVPLPMSCSGAHVAQCAMEIRLIHLLAAQVLHFGGWGNVGLGHVVFSNAAGPENASLRGRERMC